MSDRWMVQNWTTGQLNALVKNLGEENARRIQRGEVRVVLKEVLKTLFDKRGRCVPEGLSARVRDPDQNFRLGRPKLKQEVNYANRILRLHGELSVYTGITAERFQQETERLLSLVRDNSQIANIANGVWLPIVLPRMETDDVGAELERYLEAVSRSYIKAFGNREFYNYRKGTLASDVSVIDSSHHNQLIERMKREPVIGIHFPNSLQGFSINASREQMATLPKGFILSGLDTAIAMLMYPDVLARDYRTPGLYLAAFSRRSANYSFCFVVVEDVSRLDFGRTDSPSNANDSYSSGLLFLG